MIPPAEFGDEVLRLSKPRLRPESPRRRVEDRHADAQMAGSIGERPKCSGVDTAVVRTLAGCQRFQIANAQVLQGRHFH